MGNLYHRRTTGEGLWTWEAPVAVPWLAWGAAGGGLALMVVAFAVTSRGTKRRPRGLAAGAAGMLLMAAGGLWLNAPAVTAQMSGSAGQDLRGYGKALFAAKGCMTCHRHDEME